MKYRPLPVEEWPFAMILAVICAIPWADAALHLIGGVR